MDNLITFWDNNGLYIVFIFAYASVAIAFISFLINKLYSKSYDLEKAYKLLLKANEQKTLDSDAISLIYRQQIERKYDVSYIDFLEQFLIYIRQNDKDGSVTLIITSILDPILSKAKEEKPYSYLEDRERRILLAIETSFENGEKTSIKNNLTDLSDIINQNQKALNRSQKTNRWTIPISIIGIILTLFIWLYGSRLSNNDIERISEKISATIINDIPKCSMDSIGIQQ